MRRRSETTSWIQQAGLLTSIPIVLLIGPALGYYFGMLLDRKWSFAPWGVVGGACLGMGASARVVVQLIRQANALSRDDRSDTKESD